MFYIFCGLILLGCILLLFAFAYYFFEKYQPPLKDNTNPGKVLYFKKPLKKETK